jgi:SAM-dependent methyltransferase
MTSPCLRRIRVTGTGLRHARYDPELNLEARMSEIPPEIDISRPHPARIYDFFLGGKDNFTADREAAAHILRAAPFAPVMARENRAFLGRAVRFLAGEAGIRQFLDIGTGLPTTNNVHEAAQAIAPASRVVYVDNDPLVLAHARALLKSAPEGRTAYIHADLRAPATIVSDPAVRDVLDFTQPIALILAAVLHFVPDANNPAEIMKTLLGALPPGSYLAASHISGEHAQDREAEAHRPYRDAQIPLQSRDSGDFARLAFGDLDLVPPGVVLVSEWRREATGIAPPPSEVNFYGGVARKP